MTDKERTNLPTHVAEVVTALDTVTEFVYLFTLGGDFRYWNDALSEVTGYSSAEIQNMEPTDFFIADDQMRIKEAITRALNGEYVRVEATLQTKDDDHLPYEFS